jgi:hypothetical protein
MGQVRHIDAPRRHVSCGKYGYLPLPEPLQNMICGFLAAYRAQA